MSDILVGRSDASAATRSASDLYRAVWRWHFYAGLMVLPFLISLSITGGLYLFRDEIDGFVYADLMRVEVPANPAHVPATTMVDAALAAHPGTLLKFTDPISPQASAEIAINTGAQENLAVYVNPYDGRVLGALPDRGTIMWTIRTLHSLKYFGSFARALIEIAGGWSILLVATGIYLWWPRKQTGGVVTVRGTPKRRVFWRDTHAVTGIFIGVFLVFLAFTGMPWSGVWGAKVNEWANGNNFGYPAGVRVALPMSGEHLDHMAKTSWSLEQAQVPQSPMGQAANAAPITLDDVVSRFDALGLHHGYAVNVPLDAMGVYTGSVYPDDVAQQRVIHLDQYSGATLMDMRYGDYGPLGRWLEWSISIHMGQQFGLANQLVLLAVCVAIIPLAVSAAVMWWKRRPKGSLGVPPLPTDPKVFRGLIAILVVGGILFPLVGVSLAIMLVLDAIYSRWTRRAAV